MISLFLRIKIGIFDDNKEIQYGYWRNTMFTRKFEEAVKKYSSHFLRNSTLFGQKFVVDVSYDEYMVDFETSAAARQMARIYCYNKSQTTDPFDLHFCNCNLNDRVMTHFSKFTNSLNNRRSFVNIHQESYLDLFPNEKLIYLSPDAKKTLTEFDHDAIYIIGAFVDKTCKQKVSKMKAEKEGIDYLKLPIHTYLGLAPGAKKVLGFDGVFKTLLEVRKHGDWKAALIDGVMDHKLIWDVD